ncbi:putative inorganic polyphosphate/ATP-NAD kinase [Wickerhamomyces ciferrii]|uniref:Inorganic polyphosphate/ATP-NAD kinase n=1 Tax=Wickerhamomyces ciferrii (strain ATCC 14091 / BCRC 22168 / CBS 111 / JCM 3599 / NBRC 0793 / NRRL Y-1031 F-60-10) TaxID=1206466 RepID=K0KV22_WICCF|nr:putative inorganic polyphosphate/ATP-NAD kinase [Wickerhamomyces ciferrii]CCH45018.1 putative inorganic polyphosphate/ATP-NAD kinase [Wickerhamomyces ciferrii]
MAHINRSQSPALDRPYSPFSKPPVTAEQLDEKSDPEGSLDLREVNTEQVQNELEKFTFTESNHDQDDDGSNIPYGEKILETNVGTSSSDSSTPHTPIPQKRYSIGSKSVIPSLLNAQLHNLKIFEPHEGGKTHNAVKDPSSSTGDELNESRSSTGEIKECLEHDLSRLSSALMTKRQLGKVVGGIREIERTLNHVHIRAKMVNIMILTKIYDDEPNHWARIVSLFLLNYNSEINIYIQEELKTNDYYQYQDIISQNPSFAKRIHFWFGDKCAYRPEIFDLILTFGGDGTVLYASWIFQTIIPPILAFSLGSLGFLTDFNVEDHEDILSDIIENGYQCSIRMRFECTIMKSITGSDPKQSLTEQIAKLNSNCQTHQISETYCIFNEVVVDRGPNAVMSSLEVFGDKEAITTAEADGLIISTPSGSTAYSLSAGGSLVHPEIPGILISPICPHTLSFRPLVIPESIILRLGVPYDARSTAWCSFDGKNRVELGKGDFVTVTASRYPIPCIRKSASKNAWFERISETLHWNERKKQKALDLKDPHGIHDFH